MKLDVKSAAGKSSGSIDVEEAIFGAEVNVSLMHQVVNAQLAARRQGTHSTKTRAKVSGGGAKPWAQKGTGRARAGSSRSPIWVGGGIAHGPRPRDYSERTNKKMIKGALNAALSDRKNEDKIIVVDSWDFEEPSTKGAIKALEAVGAEGKTLVVLDRDDINAALSMRNLANVQTIATDQLNCHDVLNHDFIVFTKTSVPTVSSSSEEPAVPPMPEEAK